MKILLKLVNRIKYILFRLLKPESPWLPQQAVYYLESYLTDTMVGFEWGSGKSTIFFARKTNSLISIEHDGQWHDKIKAKIDKNNLSIKVDYKLIEPIDREKIKNISLDSWRGYQKLGRPPKAQFFPYFQEILKHADNSFDFILVDGRARVACVMNAVNKLKKGGILILDNSDREKYRSIRDFLKDWKKLEFSNGLQQTSIWIKNDKTSLSITS